MQPFVAGARRTGDRAFPGARCWGEENCRLPTPFEPFNPARSLRQTVFLPVTGASELAALEFATEAYSYQTAADDNPRNLVLLCTSQGTAVQASKRGQAKLFHHAVGADGAASEYWLEAERSTHAVGTEQRETNAEAAAAAARGKAVSSVIGVRALGTRFNVLMTIQVPLKMEPPPARATSWGFGGFGGSAAAFLGGPSWSGGGYPSASFGSGGGYGAGSAAMPYAGGGGVGCAAPTASFGMMGAPPAGASSSLFMGAPPGAFAPPPPAAFGSMPPAARRLATQWDAPAPPPTGVANAARVSRGSRVGPLAPLRLRAHPERDASQHVTVTVVLYYTVAGGVPSAADVVAAVDDMERLYAQCRCGGEGRAERQCRRLSAPSGGHCCVLGVGGHA